MTYHLFFLILFPTYLTINDNHQCSIRDSCLNSSSISPSIYDDAEYIQSRNCFCDSACQEYGDCCDQPNLSNSNKYECIDFLSPINNQKPSLTDPLHIWMRTKCLSIYIGSSSDIQCRNLNNQTFINNPLLFIPVTSIQTNITHRNYYCAFCNNDANENFKIWEYKPYCHGNGSIFDSMILDKEEQVNYYIHNLTRNCGTKTIIYPRIFGSNQPSVFIRPCKNSLPRICPSGTSVNLARNCSLSNTAYRYDIASKAIYHNPYCAECNHKNVTCIDPIARSGLMTTTQIRFSPLSILFDPKLLKRYINSDLNNNLTIEMIYSLSYKCKKSDEVYNLFLKKCFQLTNSNKQIIISMKCSHPILTSEEYVKTNNGGLYLTNQSILLHRDQYVFINDDHIVFCADQWKEIKPTFSFLRNILSMICTSISLVCLAIFIIAFCLIPSLHNLPGKCLLSLSISIFIGQLIFILTSDLIQYPTLCLTSAILIHYFYLSSFFWLLIIAIHIHTTFNRQIGQQEKKNEETNWLYIYNILIWCFTGIIVLSACLIQFTKPESSFSPDYGYLFCSISKSNAMILFFLVPIGCLLLIVAILFIKTIIAIHHSRKTAKLASLSSTSSLSNNSLVFVYARLASLMGLQWILLIIALIIGQDWSWIIFEIINSLPGVFICFGFLCSYRLWKNMKHNITVKLVNTRKSSKSNTTSISLVSPPS